MDVADAHLNAYNQIIKYKDYQQESNTQGEKGYFDIFNIGT
jgi:hypothetical protein